MLASERFEGSRIPFEGDRQLVLGVLPEGAQVSSARIILEPVAPPGGTLFEEDIAFTGDQGDWGARKLEQPDFAEVDFHARRTLSKVAGSNLGGASLQVDIGGLYVQINARGAMSTPDDGVDEFEYDEANELLPSLTTQKLKLSPIPSGSPQITRVCIRSAPANLSLRLGGQPPFWSRPGELARSETVPDFSAILNNFLKQAKPTDGYYQIPLTVHSDSLCRLDLKVELDYVQTLAALPGALSEAALTFDYGTLSAGTGGPISLRLPAGAQVLPGETSARVRGSFADSRILYGPTGKLAPIAGAKITAERALATPLVFAERIEFSSVDLLLTSVSRTAELALDLVEDADGKPYTRSVLPGQLKLAIDSQVQGKPSWVHVALPTAVQLASGARLWLVLQGLSGEAQWSVAGRDQLTAAAGASTWTTGEAIAADQAGGAALGMLHTQTGGLAWRGEEIAGIAGPLAGFLHLRQPPSHYQVPIELEVGAGGASRRVSLQRYAPLGRVDFDLGSVELADAINAAATATAAPIPESEHLQNGELERWRRMGDKPAMDLLDIPAKALFAGLGPAEPLAMASSPDGRRLYVAFHVTDEPYRLLAIDLVCLEQLGTLDLLTELAPRALTVSPDGRRLCASTDDRLVLVDLDRWEQLGSVQIDNLGNNAYAGRTLFSPDGSRLYVKQYNYDQTSPPPGLVHVLDAAALEQALARQALDPFREASITHLKLGSYIEPVDLAVSPDGSRLYVLTADLGSTGIYPPPPPAAYLLAYDTLAPSSEPVLRIAVGTNPLYPNDHSDGLARGGLALSPDGSRALAVNAGSATLAVVALPRGLLLTCADLSATNDVSARPVAVVVHEDGRYAAIADYGDGESGRLAVYDMTRRREVRDYPTRYPPIGLCAPAGGERIYGVCRWSTDLPLVALPMGVPTPEEWSLTSGAVHRVCAPPPFGLGAVLGDFTGLGLVRNIDSRGQLLADGVATRSPNTLSQLGGVTAVGVDLPVAAAVVRMPTALSQVVPARGGVSYALSFWGLASAPEAVAELFWYDADCGLQRADRLPFTAYAGGREPVLEGLQELLARGGILPDTSPLVLHRLKTDAPPGADLVELRLFVPGEEAAIVDRISLTATADAVSNGDLQQLDSGRIVGWTLFPATASASGAVLKDEGTGVGLHNGSKKEVALEQATGFRPQMPFDLTFVGRGEASDAGTLPRIELAFLDDTGNALSSPLSAPVEAQGSDRLLRSGESPPGTAVALLRLIAPPATCLLIQHVSLREVAMVQVPIDFVAQAPGDLRVSDLRVVYDVPQASVPTRVPPAGLCPPTPPDGTPGRGSRNRCYCPCCGESDELCDTLETETDGGQPALEGTCCHCGARQVQIVGGGYDAATAAPARELSGVIAFPFSSARKTVTMQALTVRTAVREVTVARLLDRGTSPPLIRAATAAMTVAPLSPTEATRLEASSPRAAMGEASPGTEGKRRPEEGPTSAPAAVAPSQALPAITEVTGVTEGIAAELTRASLGTLERLAEAKPSQIADALPGAEPGAPKRISRNARRLLRTVTSREDPP